MPRLLAFKDALVDARKHSEGSLSVLLGNGFSIDYDPMFAYESLANLATLTNLSVPKKRLFRTILSQDFEVVIEALKTSARLESLYGGDRDIVRRMQSDARIVRRGLAEVLAARHPDTTLAMSVSEVEHARTFLSPFYRIFTLNYDLLLYWLINRPEGPHVSKQDGFEWPTPQRSTVFIWKPKPYRPQRVFFLHGALHMFVNEDRRLQKLSYWNDGPIVEGLRQRLDNGDYPLVVTEGKRSEKEAKIERSSYLRTSLRRFGETSGALFVHGVSMSPNDDHILELIEADTSGFDALYVGVHGDPTSPNARALIARAEQIKARRRANGGRRLRLRFYQSESAQVWRDGS